MRTPSEPDLMAWDSPSRVQLDRLRRQGVVAVRYGVEACEVSLELLPDCVGPKNRYVYVSRSGSESRTLHDTKEIFAQLPVGASNLSSRLKSGPLKIDANVVGSLELPAGSTVSDIDFVGPECKRATHAVRAVYVGAFSVVAGDEPVAKEGYPAACARAATEGGELEGCSTPVRLVLIPLAGEAKAHGCAAGESWDGNACARPTGVATSACGKADEACAPPTDVDGGPARFDQASVERVVRVHQAGLRRTCWDSTPTSMKRMSIAVTIRLDAQGHVIDASPVVQDSDGPTDLTSVVSRCLGTEIRAWLFPEPESEKSLTIPFKFLRQ